MKRLTGVIILATTVLAILASCRRNPGAGIPDKPRENTPPILGTWRYTSMTYIVQGDKPDTVSTIFTPDTIQIYDIYRSDGILESYVTLRDSILRQTQMHYILRNDSIIAENDAKKVEVHVANATDSTLNFDFSLADGDKTARCQTLSEKCELPHWLKLKLEK